MPFLSNTLLVAAFAAPGALTMGLALAPRARAIRRPRLTTRALGLLVFSVVDWALALRLFGAYRESFVEAIAAFSAGAPGDRKHAITELLAAPPPALRAAGILLAVSVAMGILVRAIHSATLMGMAIGEFNLSLRLAWPSFSIRGLLSWVFGFARNILRCAKFYLAKGLHLGLKSLGLVGTVQPLGAGYWLVILEAARVLQWRDSGGQRIARVYADIVQGGESVNGRVGTLYKGTVKHMVCETDGNIVFVLLTQAARWRDIPDEEHGDGPADARDRQHDEEQRGERDPARSRGEWRPIYRSEAFALDGASIRNISFRLMDSRELEAPRRQKILEYWKEHHGAEA